MSALVSSGDTSSSGGGGGSQATSLAASHKILSSMFANPLNRLQLEITRHCYSTRGGMACHSPYLLQLRDAVHLAQDAVAKPVSTAEVTDSTVLPAATLFYAFALAADVLHHVLYSSEAGVARAASASSSSSTVASLRVLLIQSLGSLAKLLSLQLVPPTRFNLHLVCSLIQSLCAPLSSGTAQQGAATSTTTTTTTNVVGSGLTSDDDYVMVVSLMQLLTAVDGVAGAAASTSSSVITFEEAAEVKTDVWWTAVCVREYLRLMDEPQSALSSSPQSASPSPTSGPNNNNNSSSRRGVETSPLAPLPPPSASFPSSGAGQSMLQLLTNPLSGNTGGASNAATLRRSAGGAVGASSGRQPQQQVATPSGSLFGRGGVTRFAHSVASEWRSLGGMILNTSASAGASGANAAPFSPPATMTDVTNSGSDSTSTTTAAAAAAAAPRLDRYGAEVCGTIIGTQLIQAIDLLCNEERYTSSSSSSTKRGAGETSRRAAPASVMMTARQRELKKEEAVTFIEMILGLVERASIPVKQKQTFLRPPYSSAPWMLPAPVGSESSSTPYRNPVLLIMSDIVSALHHPDESELGSEDINDAHELTEATFEVAGVEMCYSPPPVSHRQQSPHQPFILFSVQLRSFLLQSLQAAAYKIVSSPSTPPLSVLFMNLLRRCCQVSFHLLHDPVLYHQANGVVFTLLDVVLRRQQALKDEWEREMRKSGSELLGGENNSACNNSRSSWREGEGQQFGSPLLSTSLRLEEAKKKLEEHDGDLSDIVWAWVAGQSQVLAAWKAPSTSSTAVSSLSAPVRNIVHLWVKLLSGATSCPSWAAVLLHYYSSSSTSLTPLVAHSSIQAAEPLGSREATGTSTRGSSERRSVHSSERSGAELMCASVTSLVGRWREAVATEAGREVVVMAVPFLLLTGFYSWLVTALGSPAPLPPDREVDVDDEHHLRQREHHKRCKLMVMCDVLPTLQWSLEAIENGTATISNTMPSTGRRGAAAKKPGSSAAADAVCTYDEEVVYFAEEEEDDDDEDEEAHDNEEEDGTHPPHVTSASRDHLWDPLLEKVMNTILHCAALYERLPRHDGEDGVGDDEDDDVEDGNDDGSGIDIGVGDDGNVLLPRGAKQQIYKKRSNRLSCVSWCLAMVRWEGGVNRSHISNSCGTTASFTTSSPSASLSSMVDVALCNILRQRAAAAQSSSTKGGVATSSGGTSSSSGAAAGHVGKAAWPHHHQGSSHATLRPEDYAAAQHLDVFLMGLHQLHQHLLSLLTQLKILLEVCPSSVSTAATTRCAISERKLSRVVAVCGVATSQLETIMNQGYLLMGAIVEVTSSSSTASSLLLSASTELVVRHYRSLRAAGHAVKISLWKVIYRYSLCTLRKQRGTTNNPLHSSANSRSSSTLSATSSSSAGQMTAFRYIAGRMATYLFHDSNTTTTALHHDTASMGSTRNPPNKAAAAPHYHDPLLTPMEATPSPPSSHVLSRVPSWRLWLEILLRCSMTVQLRVLREAALSRGSVKSAAKVGAVTLWKDVVEATSEFVTAICSEQALRALDRDVTALVTSTAATSPSSERESATAAAAELPDSVGEDDMTGYGGRSSDGEDGSLTEDEKEAEEGEMTRVHRQQMNRHKGTASSSSSSGVESGTAAAAEEEYASPLSGTRRSSGRGEDGGTLASTSFTSSSILNSTIRQQRRQQEEQEESTATLSAKVVTQTLAEATAIASVSAFWVANAMASSVAATTTASPTLASSSFSLRLSPLLDVTNTCHYAVLWWKECVGLAVLGCLAQRRWIMHVCRNLSVDDGDEGSSAGGWRRRNEWEHFRTTPGGLHSPFSSLNAVLSCRPTAAADLVSQHVRLILHMRVFESSGDDNDEDEDGLHDDRDVDSHSSSTHSSNEVKGYMAALATWEQALPAITSSVPQMLLHVMSVLRTCGGQWLHDQRKFGLSPCFRPILTTIGLHILRLVVMTIRESDGSPPPTALGLSSGVMGTTIAAEGTSATTDGGAASSGWPSQAVAAAAAAASARQRRYHVRRLIGKAEEEAVLLLLIRIVCVAVNERCPVTSQHALARRATGEPTSCHLSIPMAVIQRAFQFLSASHHFGLSYFSVPVIRAYVHCHAALLRYKGKSGSEVVMKALRPMGTEEELEERRLFDHYLGDEFDAAAASSPSGSPDRAPAQGGGRRGPVVIPTSFFPSSRLDDGGSKDTYTQKHGNPSTPANSSHDSHGVQMQLTILQQLWTLADRTAALAATSTTTIAGAASSDAGSRSEPLPIHDVWFELLKVLHESALYAPHREVRQSALSTLSSLLTTYQSSPLMVTPRLQQWVWGSVIGVSLLHIITMRRLCAVVAASSCLFRPMHLLVGKRISSLLDEDLLMEVEGVESDVWFEALPVLQLSWGIPFSYLQDRRRSAASPVRRSVNSSHALLQSPFTLSVSEEAYQGTLYRLPPPSSRRPVTTTSQGLVWASLHALLSSGGGGGGGGASAAHQLHAATVDMLDVVGHLVHFFSLNLSSSNNNNCDDARSPSPHPATHLHTPAPRSGKGEGAASSISFTAAAAAVDEASYTTRIQHFVTGYVACCCEFLLNFSTEPEPPKKLEQYKLAAARTLHSIVSSVKGLPEAYRLAMIGIAGDYCWHLPRAINDNADGSMAKKGGSPDSCGTPCGSPRGTAPPGGGSMEVCVELCHAVLHPNMSAHALRQALTTVVLQLWQSSLVVRAFHHPTPFHLAVWTDLWQWIVSHREDEDCDCSLDEPPHHHHHSSSKEAVSAGYVAIQDLLWECWLPSNWLEGYLLPAIQQHQDAAALALPPLTHTGPITKIIVPNMVNPSSNMNGSTTTPAKPPPHASSSPYPPTSSAPVLVSGLYFVRAMFQLHISTSAEEVEVKTPLVKQHLWRPPPPPGSATYSAFLPQLRVSAGLIRSYIPRMLEAGVQSVALCWLPALDDVDHAVVWGLLRCMQDGVNLILFEKEKGAAAAAVAATASSSEDGSDDGSGGEEQQQEDVIFDAVRGMLTTAERLRPLWEQPARVVTSTPSASFSSSYSSLSTRSLGLLTDSQHKALNMVVVMIQRLLLHIRVKGEEGHHTQDDDGSDSHHRSRAYEKDRDVSKQQQQQQQHHQWWVALRSLASSAGLALSRRDGEACFEGASDGANDSLLPSAAVVVLSSDVGSGSILSVTGGSVHSRSLSRSLSLSLSAADHPLPFPSRALSQAESIAHYQRALSKLDHDERSEKERVLEDATIVLTELRRHCLQLVSEDKQQARKLCLALMPYVVKCVGWCSSSSEVVVKGGESGGGSNACSHAGQRVESARVTKNNEFTFRKLLEEVLQWMIAHSQRVGLGERRKGETDTLLRPTFHS